MYQKVSIIGNLGGDPEMRYMPDGTPVTSFSVATNRRWTNKDGSPGEETVWFRVSAWFKLAEICNQYLSKGRQVYVEGKLTPDKTTGGPRVWTGNDGQPRASFDLRANEVKFLGGAGGGGGGGAPAGAASGTAASPQQAAGMTEDETSFFAVLYFTLTPDPHPQSRPRR